MRWTAKAREEDYEALADIFERSRVCSISK